MPAKDTFNTAQTAMLSLVPLMVGLALLGHAWATGAAVPPAMQAAMVVLLSAPVMWCSYGLLAK
jgi:hypothetical protein